MVFRISVKMNCGSLRCVEKMDSANFVAPGDGTFSGTADVRKGDSAWQKLRETAVCCLESIELRTILSG
jgi:hypothetical protein